jgi:hypothetical protein
MNATDALQFIEDYSSTTIDGYKSRQSIFNNIDIRRKIFGMKTDKIKDAMERNEKIVKFNKLYWDRVIIYENIFEEQFREGQIYGCFWWNRVERDSIRPMWSGIERQNSYICDSIDTIDDEYSIEEKWNNYLELGHDSIYHPMYDGRR